MELPNHELIAFNTATASENLVHDDAIAAKLGFVGGLVPGIDVYAYLCQPLIGHWGKDFFSSANLSVRLRQPVYDGNTVVVSGRFHEDDGRITTVATTKDGERATLTGRLLIAPPDARPIASAPLPIERPPASPESLGVAGPLGSFEVVCSAEDQIEYLLAVRDAMSPVADWEFVHPGWLLGNANHAISRNVLLGPWIHVGSDVQNHSPARVGESLSVRSRVRDLYERKGHRFVEADVLILGEDERPIMSVEHTAIYQPRQLRT
jgi:acyl dehydratase